MNRITLKMLTVFARISIVFCTLGAGIAQAAVVDVLVLYDTYSKNYFNGDPQTAMVNWVNQINGYYRTSQVDIQLRLVGVRYHAETGADSSAVLENLSVDTEAINLRNQLGADFVSQLHQTASCGVGWLAIHKDWAWNVIAPGCGPLTMAHELGHNMGLDHSRRQGDTTGKRYRYGLGYGVDNLFATVMAYPKAFNTTRRMGVFSNPNLRCSDVPCGIPEGQAQEAYAAKALHNVRDEVAGFRASSTEVPPGSFSLLIQAENYSWNNGVQLESTTDTGGGQNVGWIDAKDWMAYTNITIPAAGVYLIDYRVASPFSGGKLSLDLNGGSILLGQQDIPNTGGWQNWTTVTQSVTINNAGTYNIGVFAVTGGWNINWIRIRK